MTDDSNSDTDFDSFSAGGDHFESVYETIFSEIEDAVFLIDVEQRGGDYAFRFQRNNASHQEQTGLSRDELRGQTPRELLGDEQGKAVEANYRRCVEQRETIEYEESLDLPGGRRYWETKLTPIIDSGEVTRIVGVARDRTERRVREERIQSVLRRFETVLDTMSAAVFLKDTDGEYLVMNKACRDLFDVDDGEISGLTDNDLFPREVAEKARSDDRRVVERGEVVELEETVPTATGKRVRLTRKSPVTDEDGKTTAVCGVSTDITGRKEREQQLEETKQRLSLALDGTDTGVWEWDIETDEVVWTESMERLFGIEPGAFDGTYDAFTDYVHPDDLPAVEEAIDRTISTGRSFHTEYRIQASDGKQRWGEARAELVENEDGSRRLIGIVTDITDRKEYQEALEAAKGELRRVIDLVPDLIFVKNREGEYLLANEATAAVYGLTPDQVEGKREADISPSFDRSEPLCADDLAVFESGEPKEIPETELSTADGETRTLQTTKIPYRVPGSGEDAVLGYARDVTELKESKRALEDQRDTLKLLNQVMRHDIRNDLTAVMSYTELLAESVTDEMDQEYIQRILDAVDEAVEITVTAREITDVLLQIDTESSPKQLRRVLRQQIEHVRSNHEQGLVTVSDRLPNKTVMADDMLEALFRNLLTNAMVHNDKELPEVTVSATVDEDVVRVRFADNGPGIPDDLKDQIFEEGEKGLDSDGTGLGLYLVGTLVNRYGGDIRVEDNEPEGSVFTVELRRCE